MELQQREVAPDGPLRFASVYQYCSSSSSSSDLTAKQFEEPEQSRRLLAKDPEAQIKREDSDCIERNYSKWVEDQEDLDTFWQYSFVCRYLLSGLTVKDDGFPPTPFHLAMDSMKKLKTMVDTWGGGEKGFHMALTLQKLHAAKLKGKKEVEWQKWESRPGAYIRWTPSFLDLASDRLHLNIVL